MPSAPNLPAMQSASNTLIGLVGAALVLATLSDVFQSVIVPRAAGRLLRLSSYLWRFMWLLWPKIAWRIFPSDENRREDFLAVFAPTALVALLVMWITLLVLGYGALFWALRSQMVPHIHSYWAAAYFAGTSILTIGYGDIIARGGLARFAALCAGASGLGVFATTTAFLFAIFGTFQAREQFVVLLGARAGSPPSGIGLLTTAEYGGIEAAQPLTLRDGQRWIATVMESHIAYPVLAFFRSSHDYESWIGTLGTLLDASLLLMTTVEDSTGEARITYELGRHAVHDLADYFYVSHPAPTAGVERHEFDRACERLAAAGYHLREREAAWKEFTRLRSTYAQNLSALANSFNIPPLQWVGDRSSIVSPHMPVHETTQQ